MSNPISIYVAGKVTGLPYNQVVEKFKHACSFIKSMGYEPINPLDFVPNKEATWDEAKPYLMPHIKRAHAIYLINDWSQSDGAKQELIEFINDKKVIIACNDFRNLITN